MRAGIGQYEVGGALRSPPDSSRGLNAARMRRMRPYVKDWLSLLIAVAIGLAFSATIMLAVWMSQPLR